MLGSGEKKLNKWLVGFIIGGTILGITGLSKTEKGRGIIGRALESVRMLLKTFLDAAEHLGEKVASSKEQGKDVSEKL